MSKKLHPKVSVIMPVFNAAQHIDIAIRSILAQTLEEFELIVVDDNSTDGSFQILQDFASKEVRIRLYKNDTNIGVSGTANRAIKMARSQYIARMDADDISRPTRFAKQFRFLTQNQSFIAVGSHVDIIDYSGKRVGEKKFPLTHEEISRKIFIMSPMQQPSMMINSSHLPNNFEWYDTMLTSAEDIDLFFRLMQYGKLANLDETLIDYRMHPTNLSNKDPKETYRLTEYVRTKAIAEFDLRVPFKERALRFLQSIIVRLIPSRLLYSTFLLIRRYL